MSSKRREEGQVLRRMLDAPVPGKRRRGREKPMLKASCKRNMESEGLKVGDVLDSTKRGRGIQTVPAIPDDGNSLRRRISLPDIIMRCSSGCDFALDNESKPFCKSSGMYVTLLAHKM